MFPRPSVVICICFPCILQYSIFNTPYASSHLCDKWQGWLGSKERGKKKDAKLQQLINIRRREWSAGCSSGCESWGRTESSRHGECKETQPFLPRRLTLDERKNTSLKGRVLVQDREWNKIEKTLPRIKGSLIPHLLCPQQELLLLEAYKILVLPFVFTFHTQHWAYWSPRLFLLQSLDSEPLQVKDWLSINAWWMNEQGRNGMEFSLSL